MKRQKKILRATRLVVLLAIALSLAWLLRTYETYTIPAADQSLNPAYPGGTRVVVRIVGPDEPLERGADIVYAMEKDGVAYARFGRVRALPGDVVGARGGRLTVNGELIGPIGVAGSAMGEVPPGSLVILALQETHEQYPDSRELGFLPRDRVRAIIKFRFG